VALREGLAVSRVRNCAGLLCLIGILLLLSRCCTGHGAAIRCDEGYELNKAFLCSKGFSLYKKSERSATTLHDVLSWAFGTGTDDSRCAACCCELRADAFVYSTVCSPERRHRLGYTRGVLSGSFTSVLLLSVSVMLEGRHLRRRCFRR